MYSNIYTLCCHASHVGSGEGQSASANAEGEGTAADRAREDAPQTEGQSRSREKKSSKERKMAPNTPRDSELIKGKLYHMCIAYN